MGLECDLFLGEHLVFSAGLSLQLVPPFLFRFISSFPWFPWVILERIPLWFRILMLALALVAGCCCLLAQVFLLPSGPLCISVVALFSPFLSDLFVFLPEQFLSFNGLDGAIPSAFGIGPRNWQSLPPPPLGGGSMGSPDASG